MNVSYKTPYAGVFPVAPTVFAENGDLNLPGQRRVLDCTLKPTEQHAREHIAEVARAGRGNPIMVQDAPLERYDPVGAVPREPGASFRQ